MSPEPHKHHNGILAVLLICCLALLIAIFGIAALQFSSLQSESQPQEIIEVEDKNPTEEEEVSNSEGEEIRTFEGTALLPSFDYPNGWHIQSSTSITDLSATLYADDVPLDIVSESDSFWPSFRIKTFEYAGSAGPSYRSDKYIDLQGSAVEPQSAETVYESDSYSCDVIVATGVEGNMFEGDQWTYYICESENLVVEVLYSDLDAQDAITNLDFDSITQW